MFRPTKANLRENVDTEKTFRIKNVVVGVNKKIENYTTKNYDIPHYYYMTIGAITCNKDIIH